MSVAFNGIDNQVVTFQTGTTAAGNRFFCCQFFCKFPAA